MLIELLPGLMEVGSERFLFFLGASPVAVFFFFFFFFIPPLVTETDSCLACN